MKCHDKSKMKWTHYYGEDAKLFKGPDGVCIEISQWSEEKGYYGARITFTHGEFQDFIEQAEREMNGVPTREDALKRIGGQP